MNVNVAAYKRSTFISLMSLHSNVSYEWKKWKLSKNHCKQEDLDCFLSYFEGHKNVIKTLLIQVYIKILKTNY